MRESSNPFTLVVFAVDAALCVLGFDQVGFASRVAPADGEAVEGGGTGIEPAVFQAKAKQPFAGCAEIPARGAGVPGPARRTLAALRRADIRRENEGLRLIAIRVARLGQEQAQELPPLALPPTLEAGQGQPDGGVGVLSAVFAEALTVAAEIAGAVLGRIGRIKELYQPVLAVDEAGERAAQLCERESMRSPSPRGLPSAYQALGYQRPLKLLSAARPSSSDRAR